MILKACHSLPERSEPKRAANITVTFNVTYIDVPHEVCRRQGEVDVLGKGKLLPDPPCREHRGGLRVLRRKHMQ